MKLTILVFNHLKNRIVLSNTSKSEIIHSKLSIRKFSQITYNQLVVKEYGDPAEVVSMEKCTQQDYLEPNQVVAKTLASPVNPADINTIQGVYALKPDFPFVPGNEAVLEILETGNLVKSLKIGDRVIPRRNAMGTWKQIMVADEDCLIKISPNLDIVSAATLAVNPCTAYRMLNDYVQLGPGDTVIQNCANSAVGQAVVQLCAWRGIQTINVVRQRPDFDALKNFLLSLGATLVVADTDLRKTKEFKNLPKPKLALNGVSGKSATELLRNLADGATMVTYGGMSRQPVTVPVGSLIFNDVSLRGFWMTRWNSVKNNQTERLSMLSTLSKLCEEGKFKAPKHDLVPFDDFKLALQRAMPSTGMIGKKQILDFR